MNSNLKSHRLWPILLSVALLTPRLATAYPPAPHQLFYGMVRDEMGHPLRIKGAVVILETASGMQLTTKVVPDLEPDTNYELSVPMDSGITADAYQPTAISPAVRFRFRVRIGQTMYLPIQIKSDYALIGRPGQRTRLDLTLGEDSDGDGLPDAWERAVIAARGGTLESIKPGDDSDGNGLSNRDEYIAGTYAFDPEDAFTLKIAAVNQGSAILEFMAIKGRVYTILGSHDMREWLPVGFKIPGANAAQLEYDATDVRMLRVEAPPAGPGAPSLRFYKLRVR